jgi:hypothetical protein
MTVAKRSFPLGEVFEFEGMAPGDYTLVAEPIDAANRVPKFWILPLHVDSSVEQDIVLGDAHEGTLGSLLEKTEL